MAPRVTRNEAQILKVHEGPNIPFYQNMEVYQDLKAECLYDYRVEHDTAEELKECSEYLTNVPSLAITDRADKHDPEAIIELAIRFMSGCGMRRKSAEGALCTLDAITDPWRDPERSIRDASPTFMAQAHSCAAKAQYQKFMTPPSERHDLETDEVLFCRRETDELGLGQPPIVSLALAARHANESIELGLVSDSVLLVGLTLRDVGETLGVDVSQLAERAKWFRPLWRAVAQRVDEIYAEERERLAELEQEGNSNSNGFACAAEECDVRREQRTQLRACAGRCPADIKPRYCSKECQKKDWSVMHRFVCKPGLMEKTPKVLEEDKALEIFELGDPKEDEILSLIYTGPSIVASESVQN